MGTLRFFEEVVSFKIRRTFGFADYTFPDIHEPSSCQKTGFAAAATSVASTHNDTGKSEKNDPNACFFARNALSLSPRLVKAAAHPIMQQK